MYGVLANDGMCIEKGDCLRECLEWEGHDHINSLFSESDKVQFAYFSAWIEKNYEVLTSSQGLNQIYSLRLQTFGVLKNPYSCLS